jgi:hypothetical protein
MITEIVTSLPPGPEPELALERLAAQYNVKLELLTPDAVKITGPRDRVQQLLITEWHAGDQTLTELGLLQ